MATMSHRSEPGLVSSVRFGNFVTLSCCSSCRSRSRSCSSCVGYVPAWGIGFDFRGTLWEPANALLDGESMYPEPMREAIVIGNPSVYPPPSILAVAPSRAPPGDAWPPGSGSAILGAGVFAAMWILGVRDWRCHVLARHVAGRDPRTLTSGTSRCSSCPRSRSPGDTGSTRASRASRSAQRSPRSSSSGRSSSGCCSRGAIALRLGGRSVGASSSSWRLGARRVRRASPTIRRCSTRCRTCTPSRASRSSTVAGALGRPFGVAVASLLARRRSRCLGLAAWLVAWRGRRSAGVRGRRRGVHRRLDDRLAELRRAALRPDRDHVAEARACLVLRLRDLACGGARPEADIRRALLPARRRARSWHGPGATAIRCPGTRWGSRGSCSSSVS